MVKKKGHPIYSDSATTIELADEGGGTFVQVHQRIGNRHDVIAIDPDEWTHIRDAIDSMVNAASKTSDFYAPTITPAP
jgi:hypothetical protein